MSQSVIDFESGCYNQEIDFEAGGQTPENPSIILAPEIEVDSVKDEDFGTLYRVWKTWKLLGTFYQNLDGKWVVQPVTETDVEITKTFETSEQAIIVIVAVTGNLIANVAA